MRLACVDVDYRPDGAVAACLGFEDWNSPAEALHRVVAFPSYADYEPGQFYQRELPLLSACLATLPVAPGIVIVDGFVWLDGQGSRRGLGARLHESCGCAVVGVAKRPYRGAAGTAVRAVQRGGSQTSLYVSSVGLPLEQAVAGLKAMAGPHRLPTLLKRVDRLCRVAPGPQGDSPCPREWARWSRQTQFPRRRSFDRRSIPHAGVALDQGGLS